MVKPLKTLDSQWSARVRSDGAGASEKPYKAKIEKETH